MRRVGTPKELRFIRALGWTPETFEGTGPPFMAYRGLDRTPWKSTWTEVLDNILARPVIRTKPEFTKPQ